MSSGFNFYVSSLLFCPFLSLFMFFVPAVFSLISLRQGLFQVIFEKQLLDFLISQFYFIFTSLISFSPYYFL